MRSREANILLRRVVTIAGIAYDIRKAFAAIGKSPIYDYISKQ